MNVVVIAATLFHGVRRCERASAWVVKETFEQRCSIGSFVFTHALQITDERCLHFVPKSTADDSFVLAWVADLLVRNLAEVDSVLKQLVKSASREHGATGLPPSLAYSDFAANSCILQIELHLRSATLVNVSLEDSSDDFGVLFINDELSVLNAIAHRYDAPHPHA